MRYSKEFVGKPVYSLDEGRHLGTVRDLYVDRALAWLAGVHLGREGLLSRKSLLIPRENIAVFGIDAVLAQRSGVVTDNRQAPETQEWMRLEELAGRHVDTPAGTRVGTIGDVLLDDEARITGFSLSRVQMAGPIQEHPVIPREAMIDTGNDDGTMTIDLAVAEKYSLRALGRPAEALEAEILEAEKAGTLGEPEPSSAEIAPALESGEAMPAHGAHPDTPEADVLAGPVGAGEQIEEERIPDERPKPRIIKLPHLGQHPDEAEDEL